MQPGKSNATLAPVIAHLPRPGEQITVNGLKLNLTGLLPPDKGYFFLDGSLTAPPCSEGVSWAVLKTPITIGTEQLSAFRRLFSGNVRPLQALNGRLIKQSM